MEELANISVKCAVTEENKEIIKRAISNELKVDYSAWNNNEIMLSAKGYRYRISVDVLPFSNGFRICSWGEYSKCAFFLIAAIICVAFYLLLYFFLKADVNGMNLLWFVPTCFLFVSIFSAKINEPKKVMEGLFRRISKVLAVE